MKKSTPALISFLGGFTLFAASITAAVTTHQAEEISKGGIDWSIGPAPAKPRPNDDDTIKRIEYELSVVKYLAVRTLDETHKVKSENDRQNFVTELTSNPWLAGFASFGSLLLVIGQLLEWVVKRREEA